MAKARYVCQSCGAVTGKWAGKCDACGAWNAITEEAPREEVPLSGKKRKSSRLTKQIDFSPLSGSSQVIARQQTDMAEFDRVCGGGLVPGAAFLIGGDPGIGKSTLLLQIAGKLATKTDVAYISGEEAIDQIRLRAVRLGVEKTPVQLAAATNVRDIIETLDNENAPRVVIIDSIQTMYIDTIESAPGTVGQVRASAQELVRLAKRRNFVLFLVGHVTKEGAIAGPRVLEHMVDTVLYFEGERGHQFRILRSVKNRFGATDEIGVFEMMREGLVEVPNPSSFFLENRSEEVSGTAIFAGIEGSRPVLVEIQALVSPTSFAAPRRTVVGWDSGRLAMLIAVLEARCGLSFSGKDVYLNVAGGFKITEPGADLAVAAALISALHNETLPGDCVIYGEIGLTGEVRPVGQMDLRLKEAAKLGFKSAMMPPLPSKKSLPKTDLSVTEIKSVKQMVLKLAG